MQASNINILSTRFLEPQLIKEIEENNIDIDVVNFIKTSPIQSSATISAIEKVIAINATVIFTSTNAINAVAKQFNNKIPNWKIACISQATYRQAVALFGEKNILATANSAKELADKISAHQTIREVYFFCSDKRRIELPQLLQNAAIAVHEIIVYTTTLSPQKIEKNYNGILFFSPSAVESFFSCNTINNNTTLFAIGHTTAATIQTKSKNKIVISNKIDSYPFIATVIAELKNNRL